MIKPFPSPFGETAPHAGWACVAVTNWASTAVTLSVLTAVYLFFRFTKLGLAMRAAAFNPVSAGWSASRSAGCWRSAGDWRRRSARSPGCMVAPVVFLDPNMMVGILLYAFAGALLGGIDNPLGAVPAGSRSA